MSNLGNLLRDLRDARGITQSDLAIKSGLGRRTLSKIEGGTEPIRLSTLKKLAEFLDPGQKHWPELLVAWIGQAIGDEMLNVSVSPKTGAAKKASPTVEAAISKICRMPERDVELILELIDSPPLLDAVRGMVAHVNWARK